MKVLMVAGARPNFMKVASLIREIRKHPEVSVLLVHTGQHYDPNLSDIFFTELGIAPPDVHLEVGSGSHAAQTASVMMKIEPVMAEFRPHVVVVVGDVNSTMAASLTAAKLAIPVAHVEAGLRSFDRSMPEEINRVVTDAVADLLFVTEPEAMANLKREGRPENKIFHVGNVMIDTLLANLDKIDARDVLSRFHLRPQQYVVVTIHRPSNVDSHQDLLRVLSVLEEIQKQWRVVFPIHPRTRSQLREFSLEHRAEKMRNLTLIEPVGYLDFIKLVKESRLVLTDSGGIQEESTVLGIPCLTMRKNTERPVTVSIGTNKLVGSDPEWILQAFHRAISENRKPAAIPEYWDGHASERIVRILLQLHELKELATDLHGLHG
jgi:UDP-N-acetylglucosamine 2-epimerase (non-hydrolysing)